MSNGTQSILHNNGTLNPRPDAVHDGLFHTSDFFDARDLLQVRYAMLRRVAVDGWSVTQATHAFGCSRPVFYHARTAFEHEGLQGLIPHKRGPKDAHKLSTDVMMYVSHLLQAAPQLAAPQLTQAIVEHFGRLVHPRSLVRALARHTKKGGLSR
jgi:transposase